MEKQRQSPVAREGGDKRVQVYLVGRHLQNYQTSAREASKLSAIGLVCSFLYN